MWARIATGAAALGLYGWRVEDPKGSYAAFFDFSDWVTSFVLADEGLWGYVRNMVNLVLIDQADGFLLGMAFFALLSILFWPFKACGRWCLNAVRGDGRHRHEDPEKPSQRHEKQRAIVEMNSEEFYSRRSR